MSNNVRRKVIKEDERFVARLEEIKKNDKKLLFIHIELKGAVDVALIKHLRAEFEDYKRRIKSAGYDNIYSYSATPKFYSMFKGYVELGPMEGFEGYKVLKWALN